MGAKSAIEWTDASWNPLRGCSVESPGCHNCYAARIASRFSGPGLPYEGFATVTESGAPVWTGLVDLMTDRLDDPLSWRKGRRIFVSSMSDIFHESVPDAWVDKVLARMLMAPRHTFQVLTKRAKRMRDYFADGALYARVLREVDLIRASWAEQGGTRKRAADEMGRVGVADPSRVLPSHIWLGVSAESQAMLNKRAVYLMEIKAAVRFLSVEPLLEEMTLSRAESYVKGYHLNLLRGELRRGGLLVQMMEEEKGETVDAVVRQGDDLKVSWVIVGGESGSSARPMLPAWARKIRDECQGAGVPFFFKQWGAWAPRERDDGHPFDTLATHNRDRLVDARGNVHCTREAAGEGAVPMSFVSKDRATLDGAEHLEFPNELRSFKVGEVLP